MAINFSTITIFLLTLTILNSFCVADYVLGTNERLETGSSLQYGGYELIMQQDCNLVLYDNGNPVWATDTGGRSRNCYCTLQSDGNLVVYNPNGNVVWASKTARSKGYYVLILQSDRNLVIYGSAIWATGSNAVNVNSLAVDVTSGNANTTTNVHRIPTKNTTSNAVLASA